MNAVAFDPAFQTRPRVSAVGLRRALVAGMRRVLERREHLNRINVFPVPDGDTGSNLAFTLSAVMAGGLSRPTASAGELMRAVADDAIEGARGNSGAILAQFFCGISDALGNTRQLSLDVIASAVRCGARHAREALAQPREGTILSVIQVFSEALENQARGLEPWFANAFQKAQAALADTPRQLAVLRQAGVVDAGAQGFVDLLEGIHGFILEQRVSQGVAEISEEAFSSLDWHAEANVDKPWCSECLIDNAGLQRDALYAGLAELGAESVVLAGSSSRVRLHAHVADPGALFELAGRFGVVSARKAEDMRAQHRAAQRHAKVTVVTDSASDLPAGIGETLPLDLVPVRVSFGDEDFLDRVSLSHAEFYRRLREGGVLPQTSQPPSGDFRRCFELLLSHSESVVYVGLARALSGTLQSGEAAAARCGAGRVHVIDSGQVSCAQALLAIAAAECAQAGGSVPDIEAKLARLRPQTHLFAAARDIQHAVRGGRIPRWILPVARGLGLTAIARMRADGRLGVNGALFGRHRVPERFARYIARTLPKANDWRVIVGHCDAAEEAHALLVALRQRLSIRRDWLVETGPAIGAHAGPGTLVVGLQPDIPFGE
ncbi:MAG TPA: DegV family protein [Chiayiivirga sp.]|nr:DegV family protein [Chiayiivirga sp.]